MTTADITPFISTADEFAELCAQCKEMGEPLQTLVRYQELRKIDVKVRGGSTRATLDHHEAMLVLTEEITVEDCARLLAAGGNMKDVEFLADTLYNAGVTEEYQVFRAYVDMICKHSIPKDEAFRRVCDNHGVEECHYGKASVLNF